MVEQLDLPNKSFALSPNYYDCHNCTTTSLGRNQKWLKAYLNGNTLNLILFCSVSDGI